MSIRTFRDKEARKVFEGRFSSKIPAEIQRKVRMRLLQLDASRTLDDLRLPPSNRLEALKGDRKGCYSVRVNVQYRVCFRWRERDAYDVEIVDYH